MRVLGPSLVNTLKNCHITYVEDVLAHVGTDTDDLLGHAAGDAGEQFAPGRNGLRSSASILFANVVVVGGCLRLPQLLYQGKQYRVNAVKFSLPFHF